MPGIDELHTALELDEAFTQLEAAIRDACLHVSNKQHRVRAAVWLAKISEQTNNLVWKRNRNQHARLLLEQLNAGVLEAPFDMLPPSGGLPTLQPWMVYRFISPAGRSNSPPLRQSPLKLNPRSAASSALPQRSTSANGAAEGLQGPGASAGGACRDATSPRGHRAASPQQPRGAGAGRGAGGRAAGASASWQPAAAAQHAAPGEGASPAAALPAQRGVRAKRGKPGPASPAPVEDMQAAGNADAGGAAGPTRCAHVASSVARAAAKAHLDVLINRFEQRRTQWEVDAARERAAAASGSQLPLHGASKSLGPLQTADAAASRLRPTASPTPGSLRDMPLAHHLHPAVSPSKLVAQALTHPALAHPQPSPAAAHAAAAAARTACLEGHLASAAQGGSSFSADVWTMLRELEQRTQELKQDLQQPS